MTLCVYRSVRTYNARDNIRGKAIPWYFIRGESEVGRVLAPADHVVRRAASRDVDA